MALQPEPPERASDSRALTPQAIGGWPRAEIVRYVITLGVLVCLVALTGVGFAHFNDLLLLVGIAALLGGIGVVCWVAVEPSHSLTRRGISALERAYPGSIVWRDDALKRYKSQLNAALAENGESTLQSVESPWVMLHKDLFVLWHLRDQALRVAATLPRDELGMSGRPWDAPQLQVAVKSSDGPPIVFRVSVSTGRWRGSNSALGDVLVAYSSWLGAGKISRP